MAMGQAVRTVVVLLATVSTATAQGLTLGSGKPREYPYPANPQYQYPDQREQPRGARRCHKGQALYQGKCRIVRPVHQS
jgi:hypothetical protein